MAGLRAPTTLLPDDGLQPRGAGTVARMTSDAHADQPDPADLPDPAEVPDDDLDGLATLPGYTDATPGTVSLEEGVYDATVTMHIDQRAFSGRYSKEDAS